MEKLMVSLLAAVFQDKDGGLFFVEYQTNLDLERLTREHGANGTKLISATTIDQARDMTRQPDNTPDENLLFRR